MDEYEKLEGDLKTCYEEYMVTGGLRVDILSPFNVGGDYLLVIVTGGKQSQPT